MIRKAALDDCKILTKISREAKAYWGYSPEIMEIFSKELNITQKYINDNTVFVYLKNEQIIAYYSIVYLKDNIKFQKIEITKGYWLDHMFVKPIFIGQGIGSKLFYHLKNYLNNNSIKLIKILSDPNSKLFYEKMGCKYISEYPSSVAGRTTPYLEYRII